MRPSCRRPLWTQIVPWLTWVSVCGQCLRQILICEVLFFSTSSQIHCHFYFRVCVGVRSKVGKTRFLPCKVNLNFLPSSRNFNFDKFFAVTVSFLNKNVHGFNNIRNGRIENQFQTVEIWRKKKFFVKKHNFSLCDILVHWSVGYFRH